MVYPFTGRSAMGLLCFVPGEHVTARDGDRLLAVEQTVYPVFAGTRW